MNLVPFALNVTQQQVYSLKLLILYIYLHFVKSRLVVGWRECTFLSKIVLLKKNYGPRPVVLNLFTLADQ